MRIQSDGTGFVAGAFLAAAFCVAGDAAGFGVPLGAVLEVGAGFEQPVTISAIALKRNTNFFIDPPKNVLSWKSILRYQADGLSRGSLTLTGGISGTKFGKAWQL